MHALAVVAAACASFIASPSAQTEKKSKSAAAADAFDELYTKGKQANDAMKTLTARFTETTTSSLLTKPLVARGRVAVQRPSHIVLRYTDPDARTVLIDGNTMTMSWPSRSLRQVTDITTTQGRIQKYFVNGTANDLRREFTIEDHGMAGDRPNAYSITMLPKRKQIRDNLVRLDLWVNRTTLLLDAMKMTFANGDTKTMTFEDVVPNAAIAPGTFAVDRD
jgi:outer membrane lipoprotein-sorting protein